MTNYETIYPGVTYLLDPNYHFTGYKIPTGEMGGTTSIQTANQLKQVSDMLNQGMKTTELSIINPDVFEMIPKGQFEEIKRLNKLTGAESTLHAPIIDPSGFTQEGWSEENRRVVERQFEEFVKRGHELDAKGNIPVTIHASGIPGSEMMPAIPELLTPEEKKQGVKEISGRIVAVDQESGKFIPLEREKKYFPGTEGKVFTPEEELEMQNHSYWDQQLSQLLFYKERADELAAKSYPLIRNESPENFSSAQRAAAQQVENAMTYFENAYLSLRGLYHQAYKVSDEKTREVLRKASEEFKKHYSKYEESIRKNHQQDPNALSDALQTLIHSMKIITDPHMAEKGGWTVPEKYVPIEEFAKQKTSDTLSNVALKSYQEFGNNSPIISIENPPYGSAFASGKDLKNLIEDTRKKFAEKLMHENKLSKKEAESAAEKLIGATWDTSHISMIRKQGFGPEKVTKETKEIAPFVKHVHFNDNFGTTHTDLPPGMGSLPIKDILKELEKGKAKGKKIFEGGNFFQHFQTSPFPYTLEYSGSPLFQGGSSFGQAYGFQAPYFSERGAVNPSIHHSMYGSRFQTLPLELGGEVAGTQSRFAGTPNA
jgi:hypothetical protein